MTLSRYFSFLYCIIFGILFTTRGIHGTSSSTSSSSSIVVPSSPLKGFVITAYSRDTYSSPTSDTVVQQMSASGIQVIEVMATYYVQNSVNSTYIFPDPHGTPTDNDILHVMQQIAKNNMKVAMKPHIDCLDGIWRANIGTKFTTDQQWTDWFSNYTTFLLHFVDLVNQAGPGVVGYFNVGTELDGTHSHSTEWRAVIAAVRERLNDKTIPLWLGPNWNWQDMPGYMLVNFWDALDYLGVDMYAPISPNGQTDIPLPVAIEGWQPIIANLTKFWNQQGGKKGFIFAEIGYASYVDASINAPGCCTGAPDPTTQAILYSAFFDAVWSQPWMSGVFWWAWDSGNAVGNPCSTDFNVYRKPAQTVMEQTYHNSTATVYSSYFKGTSAVATVHSSSVSTTVAPLVVYSNGNYPNWQDWSWGSAVTNLHSTNDPYPGHQQSGLVTFNSSKYGAFSLHNVRNTVDVSPYTYLQFAVRISNATDSTEFTAWCCTDQDCSVTLPSAELVLYGTQLAQCSLPTSWDTNPNAALVQIPLLMLGINVTNHTNTQISRINIGAHGVEAGCSITLDNIMFV